MKFTAGEDLEFRLWAQMVDFFVGNQIVGEDDLKLCAMLCCEGFNFPDC